MPDSGRGRHTGLPLSVGLSYIEIPPFISARVDKCEVRENMRDENAGRWI